MRNEELAGTFILRREASVFKVANAAVALAMVAIPTHRQTRRLKRSGRIPVEACCR
jgi:hypothetical protein